MAFRMMACGSALSAALRGAAVRVARQNRDRNTGNLKVALRIKSSGRGKGVRLDCLFSIARSLTALGLIFRVEFAGPFLQLGGRKIFQTRRDRPAVSERIPKNAVTIAPEAVFHRHDDF